MNTGIITTTLKQKIIPNLPYVLIFWFFNKLGEAYRLASGAGFIQKLTRSITILGRTMKEPIPNFELFDLAVGLVGTAIIFIIMYYKKKNAKKWRKNVEYGSRWGTQEDIKSFIDSKPENNMIITQTESLTMNSRPAQPKYAPNKNMLVIGGSGSGKTRFVLKPNLMQCQSKDYPVSFVVTDPKSDLIRECGTMLERQGYRIKVFNTIDFSKSHHYNPLKYISSERDILKLVTAFIANTTGDQKGGDPFWEKAETLLLIALIAYLHYEAPESEQNFFTVAEMIGAMEVREDDNAFHNVVDLMFDALEEKDRNTLQSDNTVNSA